MAKLKDETRATDGVMPRGMGPLAEAKTVRFPTKMLAAIKRCALATDNNASDVIQEAVRQFLNRYEPGWLGRDERKRK